MNLHEYQARDLLKAAGIPLSDGDVAVTPSEAEAIARRVGGTVVVKAQVHAGGRGKAGGVKLARTPAEAAEHASQILGMTIKGLVVNKVLVVPAAEIATESYVGLILDRATQQPVFMVSAAGGIDIEEVAAKTPEKITRLAVDPRYGCCPIRRSSLRWRSTATGTRRARRCKIMQQLYQVFMANGCSLAEINPLVTTPDGKVLALDAKIVIDDNELDRRPDLAVLRDESAEEPSEVTARRANLTFIKLDGNVGCVVNGAGLAMATMDLVKYYGGEPANFLDIGGSSNPEKVVNALKIITADPSVKVILFNIFGGITRTDDVANGIVTATKQFKVERADRHPAHRHQREGSVPDPRERRHDGDERHGRRRLEGRGAGQGGRVSIWIGKDTRLVVQGITGRDGSFHTRQMIEYGTNVVAGVTPGKGGQTFEGRCRCSTPWPRRWRRPGANCSVIYVPPAMAAGAIEEAADAGIPLVVCITEGVPVLDMTLVMPYIAERGVRLIGPNCPGLITPGQAKVGIIPGSICKPGPVGLVSRSGTLTYEVVHHLTGNGFGQSTCVGIGGDPIVGTDFIDVLAAFNADPATEAIVMIGEIGGTAEQEAAEYIKQHVKKPVVGFVAGQTAPKGRRMGHAGAIISGSAGTAEEKFAAFEAAGIGIMRRPVDVVALLRTD